MLITEFIEGRHWQPGEIFAGDNLARFVSMVRATNGLRVEAPPFDPVALGRSYAARCEAPLLPPIVDLGWVGRVSVIARRSPRVEPCLCHNDIGRGNFIDDGDRLWLIDWECAGLGDPYYDLAITSHNNRLSVEQEATMIAAYTGRVEANHMDRLARLKVAHDLYHVFWYGFQLPRTATPERFRHGCAFHAARLAAELRSFDDDGRFIPA